MSARILIVDDEEIIIRSCLRILGDSGNVVDSAPDGWEALRKIDDLEVLQQVKEKHPDVDVIMVTGLSQVQTAVKAMKLGAFDYLSKPFDPDQLKHVVDRALERQRLLQENRSL